jgi:hypothetical protein
MGHPAIALLSWERQNDFGFRRAARVDGACDIGKGRAPVGFQQNYFFVAFPKMLP